VSKRDVPLRPALKSQFEQTINGRTVPLYAALKSFFTENLYSPLRIARRLDGAQAMIVPGMRNGLVQTSHSNASRLLRRARRATASMPSMASARFTIAAADSIRRLPVFRKR
jgi:hypothetical protein